MQILVLIVYAHIPLRCVLRSKLHIAHQRIVEVVERRRTEYALVESTHSPWPAMPRRKIHRGQTTQWRGCRTGVVGYVCIEKSYVCLEAPIRSYCRQQRL